MTDNFTTFIYWTFCVWNIGFGIGLIIMITIDIYKQKQDKKKMNQRETVEQVWASLEDVPVDENDEIEQEWRHFPAGTEKFEIWHWIENEYNISVFKDMMKLE